jgi:hypothetical protein
MSRLFLSRNLEGERKRRARLFGALGIAPPDLRGAGIHLNKLVPAVGPGAGVNTASVTTYFGRKRKAPAAEVAADANAAATETGQISRRRVPVPHQQSPTVWNEGGTEDDWRWTMAHSSEGRKETDLLDMNSDDGDEQDICDYDGDGDAQEERAHSDGDSDSAAGAAPSTSQEEARIKNEAQLMGVGSCDSDDDEAHASLAAETSNAEAVVAVVQPPSTSPVLSAQRRSAEFVPRMSQVDPAVLDALGPDWGSIVRAELNPSSSASESPASASTLEHSGRAIAARANLRHGEAAGQAAAQYHPAILRQSTSSATAQGSRKRRRGQQTLTAMAADAAKWQRLQAAKRCTPAVAECLRGLSRAQQLDMADEVLAELGGYVATAPSTATTEAAADGLPGGIGQGGGGRCRSEPHSAGCARGPTTDDHSTIGMSLTQRDEQFAREQQRIIDAEEATTTTAEQQRNALPPTVPTLAARVAQTALTTAPGTTAGAQHTGAATAPSSDDCVAPHRLLASEDGKGSIANTSLISSRFCTAPPQAFNLLA